MSDNFDRVHWSSPENLFENIGPSLSRRAVLSEKLRFLILIEKLKRQKRRKKDKNRVTGSARRVQRRAELVERKVRMKTVFEECALVSARMGLVCEKRQAAVDAAAMAQMKEFIREQPTDELVTERKTMVGGDSDCWKAAFYTEDDLHFDTKMSLHDLARHIRDGIIASRPGCEEVPKSYTDRFFDGECMACCEMEECCECEEPVTQLETELDAYHIMFEKRTPTDWHMVGYRWSSFHQVENPEDWMSLREMLEHADAQVGTADDMVRNASRVLQTDIAKQEAVNVFNEELAAMPSVRYNMTAQEISVLKRQLGYDFRVLHRQRNQSGHVVLAAQRDLARDTLRRQYKRDVDRSTALHVGATLQEIKSWWANPGHDFYMHLSEDKDVHRVLLGLVQMLGEKLHDKKLPCLTSERGNATRLSNLTLEECLALLSDRGRQRIYLDIDKVRSDYDLLFFEDCNYDLKQKEIATMMRKTGAKSAHMIFFAPDALLAEEAAESEYYDVTYTFPGEDACRSILDKIWPELLLVQNFLPGGSWIEEMVSNFVKWLLARGADVLKRFLLAPLKGGDLMTQFFGMFLELTKIEPVLRAFFAKWSKILLIKLSTVRITWKSGVGNGYQHKTETWHDWLHTRRFTDGTTVIDTEIREKHGEMWILDLWQSTGTSSLVHAPGLPNHKKCVQVIDLFESYKPGVGISRTPSYINVLHGDWQRLINWCLAEPYESLSFGIVMTTLNRIRGGLSLGENVIVSPMSIEAEDVKAVALAAYVYVGELQHVAEFVASDPELKTNYEATWKKVLKKAAKATLAIITKGMALAGYQLAIWLLEETKNVELVKIPGKKAVVVEKVIKSERKPKDLMNSVTVHLPHRGANVELPCYVCQLHKNGAFSKTGLMKDGQQFEVNRHENDPKQTLRFDPTNMAMIINRVVDAKNQHRAWGAMSLSTKIERMEEYLRTLRDTITYHEMDVQLLTGGPGVGKSTVARAMMKRLQQAGKSCAVGFPFKNLKTDYEQAEVLGFTGRHDFIAHTLWYLCGENKIDVLFLDEASSIDTELTAALCLFLGVKQLYVVGDAKQTHLNSQAGEGVDLLSTTAVGQMIDVNIAPEHIFINDYRNPAFIVKLLNFRLGYRMVSPRTQYEKPLFMTAEQYEQYKLAGNNVDREMVFSHVSAGIFGRTSDPNSREEGANISVRSNQGKTFHTVALAVTENDANTMELIGQKAVAISRHTDTLILVARHWDDPVPAAFKEWMCCDNDDNFDLVRLTPWPTHTPAKVDPILDAESRRLTALLGQIIAKRNSLSSEDTTDRVEGLAPETQTIGNLHLEFEDEDQHHTARCDDEQAIRDSFATCFFDIAEVEIALEERHTMAELRRIYWSSTLHPVLKTSPKGKALPVDSNGLIVPDADIILDFCALHDISLALYRDDNLVYVNPTYRGAIDNVRLLTLDWDGKHVTLRTCLEVEVQGILYGPHDFDNNHIRRFRNATDAVNLAEKASKKGNWFIDIHSTLIKKPSGSFGYKRIWSRPQRAELNAATEHAPLTSERYVEKPRPFSYEKLPVKHQKIRLGTDAHRMIPLVDPSNAETRFDVLFPHATTSGVTEDVDMKITPEGFLSLKHTKAGKIRRAPEGTYRSFTNGLANVYTGGDEETLCSSMRMARRLSKPTLSQETDEWAHKVAKAFVDDNFDPETKMDPLVYNGIVVNALSDIRKRNYYGRTEAERKKDPLQENRITVANKAQVKFKTPFDPMKNGQPLSMANANINLRYVAFFRQRGWRMKEAARDHLFFDDYENVKDFTMRLTKAIAQLPDSAQFLIVDAKSFDSQQGEVTVRIEYHVHRLLGASEMSLEDYYQIRKAGVSWNLLGRARGKMSGNKPSGLPDTKLGNTIVEGALASYKYSGVGEKIVAVKGDDYLLGQTGIKLDPQREKEVQAYTGIDLVETLGDSGAFIGFAVEKNGLLPDVVKRCYRMLAAPCKSYKHFTEQQQSVRDYIQEVEMNGGLRVAELGAAAIGHSSDLGGACYEILNSISHMSEETWMKSTRARRPLKAQLRGATGPQLL